MIGKIIRERRFELEIKAIDLANELGCKSQFINAWEKGRSNPPLKYIKKLSKILKVDVEILKDALVKQYAEKINNIVK